MNAAKFHIIMFMMIFMLRSVCYSQESDTVKIIQTLEDFKQQIDTGAVDLVPEYRKLYNQLPDQSRRSRRVDLADVRFKRNTELNVIYAENTKITNITYARMDVDSIRSNVLDANINLAFLALPKIWRGGLLVNPRFNMRMFLDQPSKPIRTPSNMIGLTAYMHFSNGFKSFYKFGSFSFYHHSNGQSSGSYYPDGTLNTKTGNFAVNYYELSSMIGYIYRGKIMKRDLAGNLYGRIGFQYDDILNEGTDDINPATGELALKDEYGQKRINLEVSNTFYILKKLTGKDGTRKQLREEASREESFFHYFRFIFEGSYIFLEGKDAVNAELKGYWKIPYSPNFLLTAQAGWLGHDYYNIYFTQQTWVFRIGIAAALIAGPGTKRTKMEEKYMKLVPLK